MTTSDRRLDWALGLGTVALLLLPWYRIEGGFFGLSWLSDFPGGTDVAPGLLQAVLHGRWWLAIALLLLVAAILVRSLYRQSEQRGRMLTWSGALGILFLALQGLAIGFSGWSWTITETIFGTLSTGQPSMGAGAITVSIVFILIFSFGRAECGVMKGDAFVVSAITLLVFLVAVFVFYPIASMFVGAFQDFDGSFNPDGFLGNIVDPSIWSLNCVIGEGRCGCRTGSA